MQSYNNSPSKNRNHNFYFGTDTVEKTSVMQSIYGPLQTKPIEKIDKGILNSHIVFGGHPKMYKSVAVSEYSKKVGDPGKLPSEKIAELKKEHLILEMMKFSYQATRALHIEIKNLQRRG